MEEKNCKDCNFYVQHYRKNGLRYVAIYCGHCTNRKPRGRYRKTDMICAFYQEKNKAQEKQERIKSATEYLSFIAERVNELKEIFEND